MGAYVDYHHAGLEYGSQEREFIRLVAPFNKNGTAERIAQIHPQLQPVIPGQGQRRLAALHFKELPDRLANVTRKAAVTPVFFLNTPWIGRHRAEDEPRRRDLQKRRLGRLARGGESAHHLFHYHTL